TDLGDGVFDDVVRRPEFFAGADIAHKTFQQAAALQRVGHFRVELHTVEAALVVGHGGDRAGVGAGRNLETAGHAVDAVAVAHPHIEEIARVFFVIDDAVKQAVRLALFDTGVTEFVFFTVDYGTAELRGHGLHAVADAQHRHAEL